LSIANLGLKAQRGKLTWRFPTPTPWLAMWRRVAGAGMAMQRRVAPVPTAAPERGSTARLLGLGCRV